MKNNLKTMREKNNMTQTDLAKAIGMSKSYICDLESGRRKLENVRTSTIMEICKALDCKQDKLFTPIEFTYASNGYLIVDKYYIGNSDYNYIVIDDNYFMYCPYRKEALKPAKEEELIPIKRIPSYWREGDAGDYICDGIAPKILFDNNIGRAINEEEMLEFKQKFKVTRTSDKIIYSTGNDVVIRKETFTVIQAEIDIMEGIIAERYLKEKGIEAINIAPGIINIRVK